MSSKGRDVNINCRSVLSVFHTEVCVHHSISASFNDVEWKVDIINSCAFCANCKTQKVDVAANGRDDVDFAFCNHFLEKSLAQKILTLKSYSDSKYTTKKCVYPSCLCCRQIEILTKTRYYGFLICTVFANNYFQYFRNKFVFITNTRRPNSNEHSVFSWVNLVDRFAIVTYCHLCNVLIWCSNGLNIQFTSFQIFLRNCLRIFNNFITHC